MLKLYGKTLVFGDLHIGIKSDSPSRLNVTIKVIEEILKVCDQEKIDNIIFLGDFFESRGYLHSTTLTIAYKLVSLLAEKHTVILIAGNHDMESNAYRSISPLHPFKDIENVTVVFDVLEFYLNNKQCLAVPWGFSEYKTDKKFDYVFGHFNVSGSYIRFNRVIGNINDSSYTTSPINDVRTFARLLKPNGVCMSGHIHLRTEHLYRESRIIFVGTPLELNFGETGDIHGVYLINDDDIIFKELTESPKHINLKLSECFENNILKDDNFFNKLSNNIIKKVIDIELTSEQLAILNDKLSELDIYEYVDSEICHQTYNQTNDNQQVFSEKMSIDNYLDAVFETISEDVFESANTTKEKLKERFKEYSN